MKNHSTPFALVIFASCALMSEAEADKPNYLGATAPNVRTGRTPLIGTRFLNYFRRASNSTSSSGPSASTSPACAKVSAPGESKRWWQSKARPQKDGNDENSSSVEARGLSGGSRWTRKHHSDAERVAKNFPDLLGLTGKNLLGEVCSNFLSFTVEKRQSVLAKVVMSLAHAESNFRASEKGDEAAGPDQAKGVFQLADNTRRGFGCKGDLVHAGPDSFDCVYRIFTKKSVVGKNERGLRTHWSVLMEGLVTSWKLGNGQTRKVTHPMERRFMPTFVKYVPECKSTIKPEKGPGYFDPAPIAWVDSNISSPRI